MSSREDTILVVDNEERIRKLYRKELEKSGYRVKYAASGEEALEILCARRPDLIVLAVSLPGIPGVDTLIKIKKIDKNIPIILCSSYDDYKDDFSDKKPDSYAVKSPNLNKLKKAIAEVLRQRT